MLTAMPKTQITMDLEALNSRLTKTKDQGQLTDAVKIEILSEAVKLVKMIDQQMEVSERVMIRAMEIEQKLPEGSLDHMKFDPVRDSVLK
jgi:hypothetical protein